MITLGAAKEKQGWYTENECWKAGALEIMCQSKRTVERHWKENDVTSSECNHLTILHLLELDVYSQLNLTNGY